LHAIDDSSYRDEVVYPRDLVDYACSLQSARAGSRTQFSEGEIMPAVENSDYGITIWQWADRQ
jgi:hypothetical protein